MDAALTGLVGVTAGALLSGSVQSALAWRERQRDARSSARLLYMELNAASEMIDALKDAQAWEPVVMDWREPGATWKEHREALAGVLATDDFITISTAFSYIAGLALAHDQEANQPFEKTGHRRTDEPQTFTPGGDILDTYGTAIDAAKTIALKAANAGKL